MRALTLRPHWAHAVAWLGKRIENRKRRIPKALVGDRIAIHAGSESAFNGPWLDELDAAHPGGQHRRRIQCNGAPIPLDKPQGSAKPKLIQPRAIVATAVLAGDVHADDGTGAVLRPFVPDWAFMGDLFWWRLADVWTLDSPVPVTRGQLGLWGLGETTKERVIMTPKTRMFP